MVKKKIALSGIQPSGRVHIGNYFGMMKPCLELENYELYLFIANYHALTTVQDKNEMSKNTLDLAIDYMAAGLDPKKTLFYLQSDVPEVTELTWIFNTLISMPYLSRAHAFKDAGAKSKEVNVGLFDYPVLMASDILIQDADIVPVGQDQKQHVEYARDIAEKFNRIYGDTFKIPEPKILESVKVVPGTDGRKMSKSYGNTIPLFAEEAEIRKLVMSIPTDSKGINEPKDPKSCNIFALHKLVASENELKKIEKRYREGSIGYKESKELLIEELVRLIRPMRERRANIEKNKNAVILSLKKAGKKARVRAQEKIKLVRKKIGLI